MTLQTLLTGFNSLGRVFMPAYLFQVGVQVESLMDRKLLEDLSKIYKVHKRCRWLKEKHGINIQR